MCERCRKKINSYTTPVELNLTLTVTNCLTKTLYDADKALICSAAYRRSDGCLQLLANGTRLGIEFPVSQVTDRSTGKSSSVLYIIW